MHHCRHPHDDEGSHAPPDPALQLLLAARTSWDVSFSQNITYTCQPGTWLESVGSANPTEDSLEVKYFPRNIFRLEIFSDLKYFLR